jgi:hypothetical protein
LTPEEDDDDDGDDDEDMDFDVADSRDKVTPRMNKKGKAKAADTTPRSASQANNKKAAGSTTKKPVERKKKASTAVTASAAAASATKNVSTSGPGGREKKRAIKVGELERRRARDEKFDVNTSTGDAFAIVSRHGGERHASDA